jgi:hypothetical protein
MIQGNELLTRIEARQFWEHFHKDFLMEVRALLRKQLPREYRVFVESVRERGAGATLVVEEDFEVYTAYALIVRRAPDNRVVAACEMHSPTNKGLSGKADQEKYLRKREQYVAAGVNVLEIDALLKGDRVLPPSLSELARFDRNAWTLLHQSSKRLWRGWGWSSQDALPEVEWEVEQGVLTMLNLGDALEQAVQFNQWQDLAR